MKKTKRKLSEYWDKILLEKIPSYAKFDLIEDEVKTHFSFVKWMFKRIVMPLIVFYVVLGLIFNMNVFGSLLVTLIIFIYSNFIPDIDFLITRTKNKNKESLWYERYFLLFFAPLIVYYILEGRAKPLYSKERKCFHNFKTVVVYGIFLFIVGSILWDDALKIVMLPVFGMLGFIFHLLVDKKFKAERNPRPLGRGRIL